MESVAKRRSRGLFPHEKTQIIVEIFSVGGGRCDDEKRPAGFLGDQREHISLRAALDRLDPFLSGPGASEEVLEFGSKIRIVYVGKQMHSPRKARPQGSAVWLLLAS